MTTASPGIFNAHDLEGAIDEGAIRTGQVFDSGQIQPASLDLSLGKTAWRVRAAFLPGASHTVSDRLRSGMALHKLDLTDGAVLETGCVYIVELGEALALPDGIAARANPKSSTGRIDVFVRLVTDRGVAYDRVEEGYEGPLYAEISPRTFPLLVRPGTRLTQLRLRNGRCVLSDSDLAERQASDTLISGEHDPSKPLGISIDLSDALGPVVGWRARRHAGLIDADRIGALDPADYWEPIAPCASTVLDPGEFYIFASREHLRIPADLAAEMMPIDTDLGAFRVHYAGFFDPGFGIDAGSRAVLEVRGYDAPFAIDHGQTIARLTYERLTSLAATAYGAGLSSNYQGQRLKLSKHFKAA